MTQLILEISHWGLFSFNLKGFCISYARSYRNVMEDLTLAMVKLIGLVNSVFVILFQMTLLICLIHDGYLSFYWFSLKLKRRCSFSLQRHCKYYLLHLRMLEIGLQIKINLLVSLLNNRFFDKLKKYSFFVICSMLPGILNQLQIFWQLYLIEMLGTLIALNLLEL